MAKNNKQILIFFILLIFTGSAFAQVKTFSIPQLVTDVYVLPSRCDANVKQEYTFDFNNFVYEVVGIPIMKASLYTYGAVAKDSVTNVMANTTDTVISSVSIQNAPADTSSQVAYYVVLNFNPQRSPLRIIRFTVTYTVRGMVQTLQSQSENVVMWATQWPFVINDLQLRIHLPQSFNITTSSIKPDRFAVLPYTSTLIEYKTSLPGNSLFSAKTYFPMRIDSCFIAPLPWWGILLIVTAVLVFLCICIPVCCVCGCIGRLLRGPSYYGNNYYGYSRPYDPYHTHTNYSAGYATTTGYGSLKQNSNSGGFAA